MKNKSYFVVLLVLLMMMITIVSTISAQEEESCPYLSTSEELIQLPDGTLNSLTQLVCDDGMWVSVVEAQQAEPTTTILSEESYTGQGGDLGGIEQFLDFEAANAQLEGAGIGWFDWDEEHAHNWDTRPGLYASELAYSDTSITGSRTYDLDSIFKNGIPDNLYVGITGTRVGMSQPDSSSQYSDNCISISFSESQYIGAYLVCPGMVITITDGSIWLLSGEENAHGEVCARIQISIEDYGPESIQHIDVPGNWAPCDDSEMMAGLWKDPTRHGMEGTGADYTTQNSSAPAEMVAPQTEAQSSQLGCTVSSVNRVNVRSGPGTNYSVNGTWFVNSRNVLGNNIGTDGFTWWQLDQGWVRSDVVIASVDCVTPVIPTVSAQTDDSTSTQSSQCPGVRGRRDLSNCAQDLNGDGISEEVPFDVGMPVFGAHISFNSGAIYHNCAFASAPEAGFVNSGVANDSKADHGLSACQ